MQDLCAQMYAGYKDSSDTMHDNSQNSWHFQISEKERRYGDTHWSTMTLKLFDKFFGNAERCDGFTFSATPAKLLGANMATDPFPHFIFTN